MLKAEEIADLRHAQNIVNSSVHPDTGELIFRPIRMCSFVQFSVPIIFGVLMAPPTAGYIAMFQSINQSYNAGMNYGNRNASSP